jgi:hypothetical protein
MQALVGTSGQRQRLTPLRLRGRMDCDMICARVLHLFAHHLAREFRPIAIAAQVAKINMTKVAVHDCLQRFSSGFIGKMAMPAGNTLLQTPWPARIVLQHFQIVIRFEHEDIGSAHAFTN